MFELVVIMAKTRTTLWYVLCKIIVCKFRRCKWYDGDMTWTSAFIYKSQYKISACIITACESIFLCLWGSGLLASTTVGYTPTIAAGSMPTTTTSWAHTITAGCTTSTSAVASTSASISADVMTSTSVVVNSGIFTAPNQSIREHFTTKRYGHKNREFMSAYFKGWSWLHLDDAKAHVLCLPCPNTYALIIHHFAGKNYGDEAFSSSGFSCWMSSKNGFIQHENSRKQWDSVEKWRHYIPKKKQWMPMWWHKHNWKMWPHCAV